MTDDKSTFLQQKQCLDSMEAMCSMSICTRDAEPGDGTPPRGFFCGASEHSNLPVLPLRKGRAELVDFLFLFASGKQYFEMKID